jgi:hypothetical protein
VLALRSKSAFVSCYPKMKVTRAADYKQTSAMLSAFAFKQRKVIVIIACFCGTVLPTQDEQICFVCFKKWQLEICICKVIGPA